MSNTYTQIHIHFILVVKYRKALINSTWKDRLHKYITGIIQMKLHKMIVINSMPDHLHMLVGIRPNENISQLLQVIKTESTKWINENNFTEEKFAWQTGFGGFSYSKSDLPNVIRYIENQELHHSRKSFRKEYISILKASDIEFDERFIFKELA